MVRENVRLLFELEQKTCFEFEITEWGYDPETDTIVVFRINYKTPQK